MINRMLHSFGLTIVVAAFTAAATAGLAASSAPQYHPGDQSRWSLDFRVRLEQQTAPPIEVHLTGEWISTVCAVRQGEYDAQLQIAGGNFAGNASKRASAAALEDLRQRLSRPFWVTYRADGGLLAIHFPRTVTPTDRNLLQMVATELQFVHPDSPPQSWTALERDGAGEYMAIYATTQPGRITKRKLKYLYTDGVAGAPAGTLHLVIDQSTETFSLVAGRVQSVDGTNRTVIKLSEQQSGQLATVTEVHLSNLHVLEVPELIGSLERARPEVTTSTIVTHRPDPEKALAESDNNLLEGHTTDSLLSAAFKNGTGDVQLCDRLTALFRRRPEAVAAALELLTRNGAQKQITNALGAAGSGPSASGDAIAALAILARNPDLPETLRVDALMALMQIQQPPPQAMLIPANLLHDPDQTVRSAARLMSGTLSRIGRPGHQVEADAIDASLIALYLDSRDTRESVELLGALGNSAGPAVVPVIKGALVDPRIPIRAAAARAIRLIPGSEINDVIANVMTSDPDPAVRADAIFAARFRRPMPSSIADALLRVAAADAADYVRSNAVSLLRQNPGASPLIPETLTNIADRDKNPGIRRQASEALAAIASATWSRP